MKRYFRNQEAQEEATVSQEAEAVTVTRRAIGSRSKGKPIRIPLKRCRGESVETEARAQELTLQAEGFTFDRDEDGQATTNDGPFVYVMVMSDDVAEVLEFMTGSPLPQGVTVQPVSRSTTALRDARNGEIKVTVGSDESSVVPSNSPLAAVAYLLGDRGLAKVFHEVSAAPVRSEALTPFVRTSLIRNLPSDAQAYLDEVGLSMPGVVKTASVAPAVLL